MQHGYYPSAVFHGARVFEGGAETAAAWTRRCVLYTGPHTTTFAW
jgi:hypothetical protein